MKPELLRALPKMDLLLARPALAGSPLPYALRRQAARQVLDEYRAALRAGARVRVERDALEYRRYRRTAPLGIYQKCAGLERRLREMGICVAGTGGR